MKIYGLIVRGTVLVWRKEQIQVFGLSAVLGRYAAEQAGDSKLWIRTSGVEEEREGESKIIGVGVWSSKLLVGFAGSRFPRLSQLLGFSYYSF